MKLVLSIFSIFAAMFSPEARCSSALSPVGAAGVCQAKALESYKFLYENKNIAFTGIRFTGRSDGFESYEITAKLMDIPGQPSVVILAFPKSESCELDDSLSQP